MAKKTAPDGDSTNPRPSLAPKRPKRRATTLSRQVDDPVWQALDKRMGGRDGMLEAAMGGNNEKAAVFAELLLDPAFRTHTTKELAKRAGLSMPDLVDLYRNKQWLETTLILHEKLPDIVNGAADDAKPKMVACEECKRSGKTEDGKDCWVCGGWGEVRKSGDKDKLTFVGEAVGLVKKGGPAVVVNNNQMNNTVQQPQSFDEMMRRSAITVPKQQKQITATEAEEVKE